MVVAVEQAVVAGQWAILCIHGVESDYLRWGGVATLLHWLSRLRLRVWGNVVQGIGEGLAGVWAGERPCLNACGSALVTHPPPSRRRRLLQESLARSRTRLHQKGLGTVTTWL